MNKELIITDEEREIIIEALKFYYEYNYTRGLKEDEIINPLLEKLKGE